MASSFFYRSLKPLLITILLISFTANAFPRKIKPNSVYVIKLEGTLIERKEKDKFSDMLPALIGLKPKVTIGLNHVLKNIKTASENPNFIGIYLYGGQLSAGYASIKEIRDALVKFKKSGKFIIAYADNYTQSNYYLASVADKIMLNPYGTVDIKGLSSQTTFYKKAIDKIGVEMQVVKVGTYKSAVEPYTNTEMSEANREQVLTFLQSIWNKLASEISESRKISTDNINRIADSYAALQTANTLKNNHLVDTLVYIDETDSIINSYVFGKFKANKISHNEFSTRNTAYVKNKNKIAIIYADGSIASDGGINAKTMTKICKDLETNNAVKAVVLRINSPGGSAFESEKIWRAITQLKKKKPVVVSMGNVAASGGYYIACNASKIFAQPTTITGSIGIFGLFPNLKGINDKIGLTYDGVKTNKLTDAYSTNRPFTDEERTLMQENINRGYELFVKRCAFGRKKSIDDIKTIAEGRVWSGEDALKVGLVDELGGLNDAIISAAKLSRTETFQPVIASIKSKNNSLSLVAIEHKLEENILKNKLGDYYKLFKELNDIEIQDRIQARLLFDID